MPGRIVELAEDDCFVSVYRGFLVVKDRNEERGRVPLDDVAALIGNAHGLSFTNNVMTALAERGVPLVLCANNHKPVAMVWPLDNHFVQAARILAQASARRPLKKRLWQAIVQQKLEAQASMLEACGRSHEVLRRLCRAVRSGDPQNLEAQAARHYWRLLLGQEFRRDVDQGGVNAMLNYGYAVLRATTARAVVAAGLHPSLGIFHRSGENAFQLVDDVMEAYRPCVDAAVYGLLERGASQVDKEVKRVLALLMYRDCETEAGHTPLCRCIEITALSLARCFENSSSDLVFPLTSTREWFGAVVRDIGHHGHTVWISTDVDDSDV